MVKEQLTHADNFTYKKEGSFPGDFTAHLEANEKSLTNRENFLIKV